MFDLEQAICDWKRQLHDAGVKHRATLEELESHLRDAFDALIDSGLSEQGAFETSVRQIGQAGEIKTEFDKMDVREKSRFAKWCDAHGTQIVIGSFAGLMIAMMRLILRGGLAASEEAMGFAAVATTMLLIYAGWRLIPRFFPVIKNEKVETIVVMICVASGMCCFVVLNVVVLPRIQLTPAHMLVAMIWSYIPTMVSPTFFLVLKRRELQQSAAAL